MKKFLSVCLCSLLGICAFARNYCEEYLKAFEENDYAGMEVILKEWREAEPDNVEMLIYSAISYLDYLDDETDENMDKLLKNSGTALSYLERAQALSPDRLSVYIIKCYIYLETMQLENSAAEVVAMLDRSAVNKNNWIMEDDEPIGEQQLLMFINEYCFQFFDIFDATKEYLKPIVEKIMALYPKNTVGINIAANFYVKDGNNKKAIELLKKGCKIDKNDYVLLSNLGYVYELEGKDKDAKKCYETMLKMSDPEAQKFAALCLERMQK
ncbi:MAG: tetratricopeptide repeat protein [Treponema sp.]